MLTYGPVELPEFVPFLEKNETSHSISETEAEFVKGIYENFMIKHLMVDMLRIYSRGRQSVDL